jgi:CBS domain-containing protein
VTVRPSDTARLVLDLIERHGIGRVVVVDPDDARRVLGVVTKQDLLEAYAGFVPAD